MLVLRGRQSFPSKQRIEAAHTLVTVLPSNFGNSVTNLVPDPSYGFIRQNLKELNLDSLLLSWR